MPRLPKFTLRGFKRPQDAFLDALGELERTVMTFFWQLPSGDTASVRELHDMYAGRIAYTTLLTTLDRLHRKRLLARRKEGRAFVYYTRVSREEFEGVLASEMIHGLLRRGGEGASPLLACIVDAVTLRDRDLLEELDRLVRAKRRDVDRDTVDMTAFPESRTGDTSSPTPATGADDTMRPRAKRKPR